MMRKPLLLCGIVSSALYAAMNVLIPMQWEGYSSASQTVSELSAIGAPTRPVWVLWGIIYTLFYTAFGVGVRMVAGDNRPLRIVGSLIIVHGVLGLFWPPMHQRGTETSLTDTLHIVFTAVTVLLFLLAMGFAAASFGKRFRIFSTATLVVALVFGILTGFEAPKIEANLPTPWIGVWERVNIAAYVLWLTVFTLTVLRARVNRAQMAAARNSP